MEYNILTTRKPAAVPRSGSVPGFLRSLEQSPHEPSPIRFDPVVAAWCDAPVTPARQFERARHPIGALSVAGVDDDRADGRLRYQPLGHEVAIARVGSSRFRLQVVVERNEGSRPKQRAGLAHHGVSVPPDTPGQSGVNRSYHSREPRKAFGVVFEDEKHSVVDLK